MISCRQTSGIRVISIVSGCCTLSPLVHLKQFTNILYKDIVLTKYVSVSQISENIFSITYQLICITADISAFVSGYGLMSIRRRLFCEYTLHMLLSWPVYK